MPRKKEKKFKQVVKQFWQFYLFFVHLGVNSESVTVRKTHRLKIRALTSIKVALPCYSLGSLYNNGDDNVTHSIRPAVREPKKNSPRAQKNPVLLNPPFSWNFCWLWIHNSAFFGTNSKQGGLSASRLLRGEDVELESTKTTVAWLLWATRSEQRVQPLCQAEASRPKETKMDAQYWLLAQLHRFLPSKRSIFGHVDASRHTVVVLLVFLFCDWPLQKSVIWQKPGGGGCKPFACS